MIVKTMCPGSSDYFASSDFHPPLSRGWNASVAGEVGSPRALIPPWSSPGLIFHLIRLLVSEECNIVPVLMGSERPF